MEGVWQSGARDKVRAAPAETHGSAAWEPESSCDLRCHVEDPSDLRVPSTDRPGVSSPVPGAHPAQWGVGCARRLSEIHAQFREATGAGAGRGSLIYGLCVARLTGGGAWPVAGSPRHGLRVVGVGTVRGAWTTPANTQHAGHAAAPLYRACVMPQNRGGRGPQNRAAQRPTALWPCGAPRDRPAPRSCLLCACRSQARPWTWPVRAARPRPRRPGRAPEPALCATAGAVRVCPGASLWGAR